MILRKKDISLRDRNSFGVDVEARELIEVESVEDLQHLFATNSAPERWMVLGGGNNILFTSRVEPTLITLTNRQITVVQEDKSGVTLRVESGVEWDDLVQWSVERGLWGIENLSLIPGHCGAAPVQNIGAYGVELSDSLVSVEYFEPTTQEVHKLSADECQLGYRESIFKRELKGRVIITSIEITLSKVAKPRLEYADLKSEVEQRGGEITPSLVREVVCSIRESKLPDPKVLGNGGSFFKNPIVDRAVALELQSKYSDLRLYPTPQADKVKLAAGWLIDRAGLKGYREGDVGVHINQALVLVNYGGATGAQVIEFSRMVQQRVEQLFGVAIEPEINIL